MLIPNPEMISFYGMFLGLVLEHYLQHLGRVLYYHTYVKHLKNF